MGQVMVAVKYTPVGEYFEGLVAEYVSAWRAKYRVGGNLEKRNWLMGLMKAEFEKQKNETDLKDSSPDSEEPAFHYNWRGLRKDIEGYASVFYK